MENASPGYSDGNKAFGGSGSLFLKTYEGDQAKQIPKVFPQVRELADGRIVHDAARFQRGRPAEQ